MPANTGLFATNPMAQQRYAQVVLDLPLAQVFDFLAPDAEPDDIGRLAIVPCGKRKMVGLIVSLSHTTEVKPEKLKAIVHIQRALPALAEVDWALLRFCESYYHHPLGAIAMNVLPPGLRLAKPLILKREFMLSITDAGRQSLSSLSARALVQHALLAALLAAPQIESSLRAQYPHAREALATLIEKQWINRQPLIERSSLTPRATNLLAGPALNVAQQTIVETVSAALGQFIPYLLAGITGSGKTEVYLHIAAQAFARGSQVLILLPEINLTPQFMRHIAQRFPGARIVQQHSGLADVPRLRGYSEAQSGLADIVVGTRLAVFTPLPRLGLIIVDEEHDASYKQQEGFRYSARDVAVFRAQQRDCPIVLGSATPSLESLYNVQRSRFQPLVLATRATPGAALPTIEFIDLNIERAEDGLTEKLVQAIAATITRGQQALVFINRRGFAPALVCAQCGWMPHCRQCSAKLVLHQREKRLKCHHCGFQTRIPAICADCGNHELVAAGQGTERIEVALRAKLPDARIARVDRDSTRRRGAAEKIFDAASLGEIDVLIGTQMLAKGHDFPSITLVGVVNADGAMFSADFRATERMVAQLMQVAGRAGRADLPGKVMIQTRFASLPLYQAIASQNHPGFAEMALAERKQTHLPPYSYLALLRAEASDASRLVNFMQGVIQLARQLPSKPGLHIWEPVPATLARKAGLERQQLMVQADSRAVLQHFLGLWLPEIRKGQWRGVKWIIDVDPLEV